MSRNRGHVKWCLLRMLKCRLCVTNSMHCRSSINSSTHRNYSSVAYTPITVYRCRAAEPRNQIFRTSFEKIAFLNYNRHCLIMWRVSGLKFIVHLWSERVGGGGGGWGRGNYPCTKCVESWLTETSAIFSDNRVTNTQYCLFIYFYITSIWVSHPQLTLEWLNNHIKIL